MAVLVPPSPPAIISEVNARAETLSFLETLASAAPKEPNHKKEEPSKSWSDISALALPILSKAAESNEPHKILNFLNAEIMKSDDKGLITLFRRAQRNHNSICAEDKKANPVTTYYAHHLKAPFKIPQINLTLDVQDTQVIVTSLLSVERRHKGKDNVLILDGKGHSVKEVFLDGIKLSPDSYRSTAHELIIQLNDTEKKNYTVEINSVIDPFNNTTNEGLYPSKLTNGQKILTTQCESEGARRIFFTIDRPDVMSRIRTTIIADPKKYPERLSNGDVVNQVELSDGRYSITWDDPIPKSSYLFACVLGNLSKLADTFQSKTGKTITLEAYVDPAKVERAKWALYSLKKSMEFFEKAFDNVYNYKTLKMVAVSDFNAGAMENKTLMIFNDMRMLADPNSATDAEYRDTARVIAHEYAHDKSGNETTVRSWFEIALKEAFTDFRAIHFEEWMFNSDFARPKQVQRLRELQFPEEKQEGSHPLIVKSYNDAHEIYDYTTYVLGREVFRMLKIIMDTWMPDGFRKAQSHYFEKYKERAVTFKQLLKAFNEVLKPTGHDLSQFERWFHKQGTPEVNVRMEYDPVRKEAKLYISQSCIHPKTHIEQEPLLIPFSYELLGKDGKVLCPKVNIVLNEKNLSEPITIPVPEKPVPIFMHGYSAPVILKYDYTQEDLACIVKSAKDGFICSDAARNYTLNVMKTIKEKLDLESDGKLQAENEGPILKELFDFYKGVLESKDFSRLTKIQILQIPSIRSLSQELNCYDFVRLQAVRSLFARQLAHHCKTALIEQLNKKRNQEAEVHKPSPRQMEIREFRNACFMLLSQIDERYREIVFDNFKIPRNFDNYASSFGILMNVPNTHRHEAIEAFYAKWKGDKQVFNHWLSYQTASPFCTVADLKELEKAEGYDGDNSNHVRSVLLKFIFNLPCYHDPNGEGYNYIVDRIIEIGQKKPVLAHNYLATEAFVDFEQLPERQRALMAAAMKRLDDPKAPSQTVAMVKKILEKYQPENK